MPLVLVVAIGLAVVSAVFAIQNSDVVTVSFLTFEWEASLALILILTLGTGVLIGYLAGLPSVLKGRRTSKKQQRQIAELERSLPDLDDPFEVLGDDEADYKDYKETRE